MEKSNISNFENFDILENHNKLKLLSIEDLKVTIKTLEGYLENLLLEFDLKKWNLNRFLKVVNCYFKRKGQTKTIREELFQEKFYLKRISPMAEKINRTWNEIVRLKSEMFLRTKTSGIDFQEKINQTAEFRKNLLI